MKLTLLTTADGSKTLTADEAGTEIYHSRHGALQESKYVFIQQGLEHVASLAGQVPIKILEVGFGTGLNALLGLAWATQAQKAVQYVGLEPHPIPLPLAEALGYSALTETDEADFVALHQTRRLEKPNFSAEVLPVSVEHYDPKQALADLCWFDAFSPRYQPEMWTEAIFTALHDALKPGGILVTYSAKGDVQRALKSSGFTVEKLPGPPGKREMLRATRIR
jgi:tRNA U34 5-methylaminomethyl-2-thiouridine-forming methyltransferase MnmC